MATVAEAMLMIRPQPRPRMSGKNALHMSIGPFNGHDALPEGEVEFIPGGGLEDGGVVDQDVDPPELICDPLAHAIDDGRVADIQSCDHGRIAGLRNELTGLR